MDFKEFEQQRGEVAECMARLYRTGLTTTSGGNISLRLNDELFCITPSALDKSCLTADTVAIVTMDGKNLTPHLKLSIEGEMHRLTLINRPDVDAVVHAHPCYATAFTTIRKPDGSLALNTRLIGESWFVLGEPVLVPYYRMGSEELAQAVSDAAGKCDVLLMENHGVLAVGSTLLKAFDRIEVLENAARMSVITQTMANGGYVVKSLDDAECDVLTAMGK
ncbi:MAG: class II aldolase/adducin family protein [Sphaerochaetaceae bacterium]|nr:class II aldolase/adducin family protein [Sphaerochaetaceae bacterium]